MALTKVTGDFIKDGVLTQAHLHSSHGITSSHIGEGDKLFFTNARARGAISVSGNALSYNSSTGVITSNFEESPTFSGTVLIDGVSNYTGLEVKGTGASRPSVNLSNATTGILGQMYATESSALVFATTTSGTTALTLDSSQNATFSGDITLDDDLNFSTNGFADISNTGTGAMRFKPSSQTLALTLTGANATFAGTLDVTSTSNFTGQINVGSVVPRIDSTFSLGSNSLRFASIYGDGLTITNNATFGGNISLADGSSAYFGDSNDLRIAHVGGNSKIQDSGTGSLVLDTNGASILLTKSDTEHLAKFLTDGSVELYHDNSKKFETTSSGVSVTGGATLTGTLTGTRFNANNNVAYYGKDSSGTDRRLIRYGTDNNTYIADGIGELYFQNSGGQKKVWHQGNDGSGSGLDADLLDGQHASAFASSSHTHAASDITSGNLAAARNTVNLANVASSSDASGVYFRSANEVISGEGWATAQYAYNHNDGFLFLNRNSSSTAFPTFHIGGWNNAGYAGYSDADGLLTLTRSDGTKSQGSTYAGTGLSNTSYYTNIIKTTTKTIFRDAQSLHEFTGAATFAGNIITSGVAGDGTPLLTLTGSASATFNWISKSLHANLTAGETNLHLFGKAASTKNSGYIGYTWAGDGSNNNYVGIGQYSANHLFRVYGDQVLSTISLRSDVDMHAPIFYDKANTSYYLDPNSNTSLRTVGDWRSDSSTWSGEFAGKMQYHSDWWYIQTTNGVFVRNASGANNITLNAGGIGTAAADWRAPIFYDSNDTNYYIDPNSTSYVKYLGRREHQSGHFVGSYNNIGGNSAKSNPIYTIGSSYNPNETNLGDMYGIGYAHPNLSAWVILFSLMVLKLKLNC